MVAHDPQVWPAAMIDHPTYRRENEAAYIVMCWRCHYYKPVHSGDDLAETEGWAARHRDNLRGL